MLAGVDYLAGDVLEQPGAATILFVCFVGPALLLTPVWAAVGTPDRQEARLRHRLGRARGRRRCSPLARSRPARRGLRRDRARRRGLRRLPGLPDGDAARRRRGRRRAHRARTAPGSTPACGPPARPSAWRSGPAVFAVVLALGGYLSSQGRRDVTQPDSALTAITLGFSVLPAALTLLSLWWLRQLHPRRRRGGGRGSPTEPTHDATPSTGCGTLQARRPAGPRRPHPGLRLRLR